MNEDEHWAQLLNRMHSLQDVSPELSAAAREIYDELVEELGPDALTPKDGKHPGKHLPAVPTRKETLSLIRVARPGRDRLVLRLFYASGIRVSELVSLKPADVRPSERTLFVRSGKGDKDRYVCIDPKTMRMLERWLVSRPASSDTVFDVQERQVNRIVKKYADKLGLVDKYLSMNRSFSPHTLRHAFATHCYENGMDLFTLRKLLGHEFLSTTELYVEVGMKYTRKIYRRHHVLCLRRGDAEAGDEKEG